MITTNWIALNYSQYSFSMMKVSDFLEQRQVASGLGEQKFNPDLSDSLRLF
jgi:hypothetical protein